MNNFNIVFAQLVEGVVNYSKHHQNRHRNHTFTDLGKNYLRKKHNLVPEYAKSKSELKQILDNIQKYGSPKIFFPNQAHEIFGKYKIDIEQVKHGSPKQLGNMNLQISYIPQSGNFKVTRI